MQAGVGLQLRQDCFYFRVHQRLGSSSVTYTERFQVCIHYFAKEREQNVDQVIIKFVSQITYLLKINDAYVVHEAWISGSNSELYLWVWIL